MMFNSKIASYMANQQTAISETIKVHIYKQPNKLEIELALYLTTDKCSLVGCFSKVNTIVQKNLIFRKV